MKDVLLEDGDGNVHDPQVETSVFWGERWKEELREGPRVGSGFSSSLSNEKKDGMVEGKMVHLQRDLYDTEVSQECWNTSLEATSQKADWFIFILKDE